MTLRERWEAGLDWLTIGWLAFVFCIEWAADRIRRWTGWLGCLLLLGACSSCATRVAHYVGIPPRATASTFCDAEGNIRSALGAEIFYIRPDGTPATRWPFPELLAHETVHRAQMEARRPKPGVCPPDFTWAELVDAEIEAYCVEYAVAISRGSHPAVLGMIYADAFRRQFQPMLGNAVAEYVAPRWSKACPAFDLSWDAP